MNTLTGWIYIGAYSVSFLVISIVLIAFWFAFHGFFGHLYNNSKLPFYTLLFFILPASFLSYFLLAYQYNLYPPSLEKNISNTENISLYIAELDNSAKQLQKEFSDPQNLTIRQLKHALHKLLTFTRRSQPVITAQQKEIKALSSQVSLERARAKESLRHANEIQSITKNQLEAIKVLITSDAKKASNEAFFKGIIISFPMGIVTSILAGWMLRKYRSEKTSKEKINT